MTRTARIPVAATTLALALCAAPASANLAAVPRVPGVVGAPQPLEATPLVVESEELEFDCTGFEATGACVFEARYRVHNPTGEPQSVLAAFYGLGAPEVEIRVDDLPSRAELSPAEQHRLDLAVARGTLQPEETAEWLEREAQRTGFTLDVGPGERRSIVAVGSVRPGRRQLGGGFNPAAYTRHLLADVEIGEVYDWLDLDYLLAPLDTWADVGRVTLTVRYPSAWTLDADFLGYPGDRPRVVTAEVELPRATPAEPEPPAPIEETPDAGEPAPEAAEPSAGEVGEPAEAAGAAEEPAAPAEEVPRFVGPAEVVPIEEPGEAVPTEGPSLEAWTIVEEGGVTVATITVDEDLPPVLQLDFDVPEPVTVHTGGPVFGFGGMVGEGAEDFVVRLGYEFGVPGWLLFSVVADTEFEDFATLALQIEAASPIPYLPILPSVDVGLGLPIQLLPEARVGIRFLAGFSWGPVGFSATFDLYPELETDDPQFFQIGLYALLLL